MAHIEAQGRAESTLARYRSCINANIRPRLGAKAINKLGPAEIDRYYAQLGRTGLTPLSVRKSHAILSAAFNQALRWGWLDWGSHPKYSTEVNRGESASCCHRSPPGAWPRGSSSGA
jgi:hypothetical protein